MLVGNQEGKSTACIYEAACYALNCHPYKKLRIPNTGWIISAKPLKDAVEKDILPKIHELVGTEDILDIKKNSQGIPHKIIWRTGSVSYILSAEQDDKVFEGSTIDWAACDEPFRRSIYIAVSRGLQASGGHLWWSMTPIEEPWIYEELYEKAKAGDPNIEIFEGEPGENIHISAEERARFRGKLTEDEVQTRIHGKFAHLAGRVIKSYNPEIHRVPSFDIPQHWPVWAATDPHRHKPHAVLFLACAPTGAFYVCNEIWLRCDIKDLGLLSLELGSQYRLVERMIDTSAQEEDHRDKLSARDILEGVGWKTKLAQKKNKYSSGLMLINQLFSDGRLFIMEHCKRTHKELTLHVYRKTRADGGRVLEEPEGKMNDMISCLRYILVERPDFEGPARIYEREVPYKRIFA